MIRTNCGRRFVAVSEGSSGSRARLIALVVRVIEPDSIPVDRFPVARQLSELGVTSIKMVNLMLSVEIEFDIEIPQSEITPENFHSVETMHALVARVLEMSPAER